MTWPARLPLANLPTRIDPMPRLTAALDGPELWIKRDDHTGTEIAGNKVRKLEFAVQEALDTGCDTLITCGGIQSNHARATAAVAARLGLRCILVLNTEPDPVKQGNYLLDELLGAEVRFIAPTDTPRRMEIMGGVRAELAAQGRKGYILPVGASNGIGSFGYVNAMREIAEQEKALGFRFDAIVCAVGSGGTFGGLVVGHRREGHPGVLYGVPICDNAALFTPIVLDIIQQTVAILDEPLAFTAGDLNFLDGYAGRGYALSQPEEIDSIRLVAKTEGIILDPVYSGKAMHGLLTEIRKGTFAKGQRILFIHTGGLFGVFHFLSGGEAAFGARK